MSEFDKKISALTSGSLSTATDEYVIARGGGNLKISGADVAAAATKVGTLADLTVSGDLTVDTSTLKVDSANNRVGIGTASPVYTMDINATGSQTLAIRTNTSGDPTLYLEAAGSNAGFVKYSRSENTLQFSGQNPTVHARIDASGNLTVNRTNATQDQPVISFTDAQDNTGYLGIRSAVEAGEQGASFAADTALFFGRMVGGTFTERARITAGGYLKASNAGTYLNATGAFHELSVSSNERIAALRNTNATPQGVFTYFSAATPNNTSSYFLYCEDSTNVKAIIYSDGSFEGRANSYGGISDIKVKQDIVDAASQWDDIKGVRLRKFRFKDTPDAPLHLGVIAQEIEQVSPGLVAESPDFKQVEVEVEVEKSRVVMHEVEEIVTDAEGVESVVMKSVPMLDKDGKEITETYTETETRTEREATGTVTKSVRYSVLYMKAVGALQEAMARIESLEARLDSLENL